MAKQSKPRKPVDIWAEDVWSHENTIPLERDQILVNDDPEGDPDKLARHGEADVVRPKKK